ncbi:MAG: immunoglobulin domain-containing protein, partial [Flavobacteriales bacterium]|nr:immunoglobulin domain-containing protein [Flavobacteriales bacterium]
MALNARQATAAVYQVGTGTSSRTTSGITPFTTIYEDNRVQYLYLASELTAAGASAGLIQSLAINITLIGGPNPDNVNIKIAQVTGYTNITSLQSASFSNVYSAASISPVLGWNTYTFSSSFNWDGTSNLLVEICRDNDDWGSNYGIQCTQFAAGVSRTFGYYTDGVAGCSMTSGSSASASNRRYRPNMRFDIVAAVPCSGTPDAGTIPATLGVCPGNSTTIPASGTAEGTGISFQWQEWDGSTWVDAVGGSGATTISYTTPVISSPMQYRLQTTCSNGGAQAYSNTCTVSSVMSLACYCVVGSSSDDNTGLTNVTFNTIDNSSTGAPAYTDYTAQSTNVIAGNSYPLSVRVNTAGNYTVYVSAWIDWDQSGTFDAGEAYDLGFVTNVADGAPNGSPVLVNVPLTAIPGNTIMRVRATYYYAAQPCGNQNYSEAEDYTIQVTGCSGPTPTASAANDGPACVDGTVQLTGTTDVGTSFTWTGPNGFTSNAQNPDIPSATLADAGTYTLVVSTGPGTCTSAPATTVVEVYAPPTDVVANSSLSTVCEGGTVDLSSSATAPVLTVLQEDFEGNVAGWMVENLSTGGTPANAAWALYLSDVNTYSNDASIFAGANSDAQGAGGTTNTSLISPVFSLVGMANATLSFYHYFRYNSGEEGNVQITTDGTNWTTLQSYTTTTGSGAGFTAASISLDAYLGQTNLQIRFQYLATWDWYWLVDNVTISGDVTMSYAWSSDPAGFTSGDQNPAGVTVATSTTYTVIATSNGCGNTADVIVNTVAPPDAGTNGSLSACSGGAAMSMLDALGGTPDGDGTWSGPSNVVGHLYDPATMDPGLYTYTVDPTAPCTQPASASVTVNESGRLATVSITTDANGDQISWEIVDGNNDVIASGGPYPGQDNMEVTESACLSDEQGSWYGFRLMDSNGDGISGGGWELRTPDGKLILREEFSTGASSPANPPLSGSYGNSHSFALPLAAPAVHPAECGVFDNRSAHKLFANKVAGTNYQGGTPNYHFELSDPDSGFIRPIKK